MHHLTDLQEPEESASRRSTCSLHSRTASVSSAASCDSRLSSASTVTVIARDFEWHPDHLLNFTLPKVSPEIGSRATLRKRRNPPLVEPCGPDWLRYAGLGLYVPDPSATESEVDIYCPTTNSVARVPRNRVRRITPAEGRALRCLMAPRVAAKQPSPAMQRWAAEQIEWQTAGPFFFADKEGAVFAQLSAAVFVCGSGDVPREVPTAFLRLGDEYCLAVGRSSPQRGAQSC
jgi:hypothetical protein